MTITPIDKYSDKDFVLEFHSFENDYSITFLDIIEPNNGRVLREVKVTYKGTDITEELYGNWNYTDLIEYNKFEFSSADGSYLFFPAENSIIIFDTKTSSKFSFQKNHSFSLNYFDEKSLFVIGYNKLTIIDLVNSSSEEIATGFSFDFAFYKTNELYILSLQKGLYRRNKLENNFELINNIELPKDIFLSEYYKEFEAVSSDKNKGFSFALGVKTINNLTNNYNINSWTLVSRTSDGKLIIGTNVPETTEKLKDDYSYTHWFYGNARYAMLEY